MSMALARPTARRLLLAYLDLTKPRIMTLVILTGVPALLMARPAFPDPRVFWGTLAGIALSAGSASSFNHYFDRDIDRLMRRTATRPLPSGLLPPSHALGLGFGLAALSWIVLLGTSNALAGLLALFSIFYYAVIYTAWLKRTSVHNIVIGGAAGAFPPMIGWAAATGGLSAEPLLLFLIIFLWTPPHFWALSLNLAGEYARAGVPMLPVVAGRAETKRQILLYSVLLAPVSLLPWTLGFAGAIYGAAAAVLGAIMIFLSWQVRRSNDRERQPARRLFVFSILYLVLLFGALLMNAVPYVQPL